jgi:hypothetical protein
MKDLAIRTLATLVKLDRSLLESLGLPGWRAIAIAMSKKALQTGAQRAL